MTCEIAIIAKPALKGRANAVAISFCKNVCHDHGQSAEIFSAFVLRNGGTFGRFGRRFCATRGNFGGRSFGNCEARLGWPQFKNRKWEQRSSQSVLLLHVHCDQNGNKQCGVWWIPAKQSMGADGRPLFHEVKNNFVFVNEVSDLIPSIVLRVPTPSLDWSIKRSL